VTLTQELIATSVLGLSVCPAHPQVLSAFTTLRRMASTTRFRTCETGGDPAMTTASDATVTIRLRPGSLLTHPELHAEKEALRHGDPVLCRGLIVTGASFG
jgi:hypothetical protein